jgi:Ca2+/H+ antiporter
VRPERNTPSIGPTKSVVSSVMSVTLLLFGVSMLTCSSFLQEKESIEITAVESSSTFDFFIFFFY